DSVGAIAARQADHTNRIAARENHHTAGLPMQEMEEIMPSARYSDPEKYHIGHQMIGHSYQSERKRCVSPPNPEWYSKIRFCRETTPLKVKPPSYCICQ